MKIVDMLHCHDRVAIVTGGTGWLGSSMCEALTDIGMSVHVVSRGKSQSFLAPNDQMIQHTKDLSLKNEVKDFIEDIVASSGRIDVLVNNSFSWPKTVNFMDATWEGMQETLETGLVAQLYLTKLVFQQMMAQPSGGSIINVCSMYGKVSPDFSIYRGVGGNAIEYGAAKAGLLQATRYLASIGGQHKIRVNAISPGPFPRPGAFTDKEWFQDELSKKTMLHRVGNIEEVKGAIAFLASDMSSYVTGADIAVDGGWTAW